MSLALPETCPARVSWARMALAISPLQASTVSMIPERWSRDGFRDHRRHLGDFAADGFVGGGGLLGQIANLIGHQRKAAPGRAGARGFDRGVDREHMGLAGDAIDQFDGRRDGGGKARHGFDAVAGFCGLGGGVLDGGDGGADGAADDADRAREFATDTVKVTDAGFRGGGPVHGVFELALRFERAGRHLLGGFAHRLVFFQHLLNGGLDLVENGGAEPAQGGAHVRRRAGRGGVLCAGFLRLDWGQSGGPVRHGRSFAGRQQDRGQASLWSCRRRALTRRPQPADAGGTGNQQGERPREPGCAGRDEQQKCCGFDR